MILTSHRADAAADQLYAAKAQIEGKITRYREWHIFQAICFLCIALLAIAWPALTAMSGGIWACSLW